MAKSEEAESRQPTELDRLIGSRVRAARGSRSQQELAEWMSGDPNVVGRWYPNTVALVERGSRPLRLPEAVVISRLFGVSLDSLAGHHSVTEDHLRARAVAAEDAVERAYQALSSLRPDPLVLPGDVY